MTEKAVVERRIDLHNNGSIVEPAWELQKSGASKAFPFVVGAAGAGIGYFSEFDYEGESYSGNEGALLLGLGGLVGSMLLQKVLLPSSKRRRYVPSQREEWMESLNRQSRRHFLAVKQYNNDHLLLVPRGSYGPFAREAQAYEDRGMPMEGRDPGELMAKNNRRSGENFLKGVLLLIGTAAVLDAAGSGSSYDGDSYEQRTCSNCQGRGVIYGADGVYQNCFCNN